MLKTYLLAGTPVEIDRLRLQASVWEPEAEALLDHIGIRPGWACIDLGCGPVGILGPLSRRVGAEGRVVGVDMDPRQIEAASAMVRNAGLSNVELVERDAYSTDLPSASFDLVHVRFVLASVGREDELLTEMLRLVRPGGVIAIQEPDSGSWDFHPGRQGWDVLKQVILAAFATGGGDFDAGRRVFRLLRQAGLEEVQVRAAVLALTPQDPYQRLPVHFGESLRHRILERDLLGEVELDNALGDCEQLARDPEVYATTFTLTQVWGAAPSLLRGAFTR